MTTEHYVEIAMKFCNVLKYTEILSEYKSTPTIDMSILKDANKSSEYKLGFLFDDSDLRTSLYVYKKIVLLNFLECIGFCGNPLSDNDVYLCKNKIDYIMEEIKDDFTVKFDIKCKGGKYGKKE